MTCIATSITLSDVQKYRAVADRMNNLVQFDWLNAYVPELSAATRYCLNSALEKDPSFRHNISGIKKLIQETEAKEWKEDEDSKYVAQVNLCYHLIENWKNATKDVSARDGYFGESSFCFCMTHLNPSNRSIMLQYCQESVKIDKYDSEKARRVVCEFFRHIETELSGAKLCRLLGKEVDVVKSTLDLFHQLSEAQQENLLNECLGTSITRISRFLE